MDRHCLVQVEISRRQVQVAALHAFKRSSSKNRTQAFNAADDKAARHSAENYTGYTALQIACTLGKVASAETSMTGPSCYRNSLRMLASIT